MIPARYQSSRFPGKPLAKIEGKPMIWWVYHQTRKSQKLDDVFVVTDDERISCVCKNYKIPVIVTGSADTGTDRIAIASKKVKADLYVNIQGDEPLIETHTIEHILKPFLEKNEIQVANLMTKIKDPVEVTNFTIPKVLTNEEGIAIYLTRSAAPYPKGSIDFHYYKQVCVYGFTPEALEFYSKTPRGVLEKIEDIEILRFIENGYRVPFIEVESDTIAVDTPKDLEKVRSIMARKNLMSGS